MKSILTKNLNYKKARSEQGFGLVETVIAMTTLGVCLAYAMPLFLYAKINNSKSQIRTGSLIVAQRVFDNIRSKSFNEMPLSNGGVAGGYAAFTNPAPLNGGTAYITSANPESIPANVSSVTPAEELLTYAMGRQYQTKVTYCDGYDPSGTAAQQAICSGQYRKFKVEVSYNGSQVYNLEGTITEF
jgi:type II secretory pathway pseudopilin PulG